MMLYNAHRALLSGVLEKCSAASGVAHRVDVDVEMFREIDENVQEVPSNSTGSLVHTELGERGYFEIHVIIMS